MKPEYTIELVDKRTWYGKTRFWWRLRYKNGAILAAGETYSSRAARDDTAEHLSKVTGFPTKKVDA